jgi:4-hydroxy-tetrahydrodipicolinate synthase
MTAKPMIEGTWGTLLLPINSDGSIDWGRLEANVDALIESEVSGVYSNGTAGEFYNQTEEEFDRISEIVAERCQRASMPFQLGVSHPSPWQSRERLRRMVELDPLAFQVILPDWFPPVMEERRIFLEGMANAAGSIPLVLYNPTHAKVLLSPEEFGALHRSIPSLAGIKVAGGDDDWFAAMRENCSGLAVFVPGHVLASSLAKGAHGSYSNVACLNPRVTMQWYRQMKEDLPAALELEGRIQEFLATQIRPYISEHGYSNQAVDKFMACIGGWAPMTTQLRWPYRSIPESGIIPAREVGRKLIPEFF